MLSADSTTVGIATALFFTVGLIVLREPIGRIAHMIGAGLHALWIGVCSLRADAEMAAFMAETEREAKRKARADVERAAHEAATHPVRQKLDTYA